MALTPRKRPGPQPKGRRRQFTFRLPEDQFEHYKRLAAGECMSLADYLAAQLALGHGLDEPEYVRRSRPPKQDPLPLTGTG